MDFVEMQPGAGALAAVLWFKIGFTLLFWATPLLLAGSATFERFGYPAPRTTVWTRVLGVAFLALTVGYVQGVLTLGAGGWPLGTVVVGIVSNGGACLVLLMYGWMGEYRGWGLWARRSMWLFCAVTGLITLGLVVTGLR